MRRVKSVSIFVPLGCSIKLGKQKLSLKEVNEQYLFFLYTTFPIHQGEQQCKFGLFFVVVVFWG